MADRLPSSTVLRTKRGRQSADWYLDLQSVRGRMLQEVERLEASKQASHLLDLPRMRTLIENWPTTGYQDLDTKRTHHIALTRGFSVGRFLLQHETR
jgi:asparagine synthase (glutamine-hydrolysing)